MSKYQLAQFNVGLMKEPLEAPSMAEFVANLDRVNAPFAFGSECPAI